MANILGMKSGNFAGFDINLSSFFLAKAWFLKLNETFLSSVKYAAMLLSGQMFYLLIKAIMRHCEDDVAMETDTVTNRQILIA